MPKLIRPLTSKEVDAITHPGTHHVGGVSNLLLLIKPSGERYYVLRYRKPDGKLSKISLGTCRKVTLQEARKKALEASDKLRLGIPLTSPKKPVEKSEEAQKPTFAQVAMQWFDERQSSGFWSQNRRGAQHALHYLNKYILPALGSVPIDEVTPRHVFETILPIYQTKSGTADKCLIHLRSIFFWAKAHDFMPSSSENPANIQGTLGVLFAPYKQRTKAKHYAALAFDEIPDFFKDLHAKGGISARALEFAILACLRSKMVRYMRWSNVDFEHHLVKIESDTIKTKSRGDHYVFLSTQAENLLKNLPRYDGCDLVFPSPKLLSVMSDASLSKVIKDMSEKRPWLDPVMSKEEGRPVLATMHGTARATFKTWASTGENRRELDSDAVELCLAHKLRDDYDGAYNRAELEPERRKVMQTWSDFCYSKI